MKPQADILDKKYWDRVVKSLHLLGGQFRPSPQDLAEAMISDLDIEWSNPNLKILDPSCGIGTFLRSCYIRLIEHHSSEHILSNMLYGIEVSPIRNKVLRNSGFLNIMEKDFLEDMPKGWPDNFNLIIANPPYTKGKNKVFYRSFIEKSYSSLLCKDGIVCMVTPHKWIEDKGGSHSSLFKNMLAEGGFSVIKPFDADQVFQIAMGTETSYFVYNKGKEIGSKNIISNKEKDPREEKLGLILNGAIFPKSGKGFREFVSRADKDFIYPVYVSSKEDRRNVYAKEIPKGYGVQKLVVSHIIDPKNPSHFSEVSKDKGVGRYSKYFEFSTAEECNNAIEFFGSVTYSFIDSVKRNGRYSYLVLPKYDFKEKWDDTKFLNSIGLELKDIL